MSTYARWLFLSGENVGNVIYLRSNVLLFMKTHFLSDPMTFWILGKKTIVSPGKVHSGSAKCWIPALLLIPPPNRDYLYLSLSAECYSMYLM